MGWRRRPKPRQDKKNCDHYWVKLKDRWVCVSCGTEKGDG